jgi:hypothetical protein
MRWKGEEHPGDFSEPLYHGNRFVKAKQIKIRFKEAVE